MPQILKGKYPKKLFGEIRLKGGLNNLTQVLKTKYLLPTKEFKEGKAVIEIIVPDSIKAVSIDKEELKNIPERIEKLSLIIDNLESSEDRELVAEQITFIKKLHEKMQNTKKLPFAVKSFRFTEKDYVKTQHLMSYLARLFGYLFYKYKNEIEKTSKVEYLASSRNAYASGMSEKVYNSFINGFMEGVNEVEIKDEK